MSRNPERFREYRRDRARRLAEAGACVDCQRPRSDRSRWHCDACLAVRRQYYRRYRRKAA